MCQSCFLEQLALPIDFLLIGAYQCRGGRSGGSRLAGPDALDAFTDQIAVIDYTADGEDLIARKASVLVGLGQRALHVLVVGLGYLGGDRVRDNAALDGIEQAFLSPFEQADDYQRAADAATAVMRRDPSATVAIWTPLKDMETFDGFLRRLSSGKPGPVLVAEARLRPLTNPMKMNGCTLVMLNPPDGAEAVAQEVCSWVAETLGDTGARAEVWWASP